MAPKHRRTKKKSGTSLTGDESEPPSNISPFRSGIINVKVGQSQELFTFHRNILPQPDVLLPKLYVERGEYDCSDCTFSGFHCPTNEGTLVIPDITPPLFDLVLRFLYGTPFESLKPIFDSLIEPNNGDRSTIQPACELYLFTLKYGLQDLRDKVFSYIESQAETTYETILEAAKYVYTHAPSVEDPFREFFRNKTLAALTNPEVADEAWFLDIFEQSYNGLSKDVFQCYRDTYKISRADADTASLEMGRSVDEEPFGEPFHRHRPTDIEEQDHEEPSESGTVTPNTEPEEVLSAPASPSGSILNDYVQEDYPVAEPALPTGHSPMEVMWEEGSPEEEPEPKAEVVTIESLRRFLKDEVLSIKERKKLRKHMEAAGIEFDDLDQPVYPEPEQGQAQPCEAIEEAIVDEPGHHCRNCGVKQV